VYDRLYAEYATLHDYFGRGGNDVMHRLRAMRREAHR
jgi:L-ribulokinase